MEKRRWEVKVQREVEPVEEESIENQQFAAAIAING